MAKLKAYIDNKFWRATLTPEQILEKLYDKKSKGEENYWALGKLIGEGVSFETVPNRNAEMIDKEPSVLIVGDFTGISYLTGEVREAMGAFLPAYFRKMIVAQMQRNQGINETVFAIEIGVELTGRTIPWAWTVSNILPPDKSSAKQRLIDKLEELGHMKLPEPAKVKAVKAA